MKEQFSIIASIDLNRGIGWKNTIPWILPKDLAHFKNTTINNVVIMGRKTWDSLPSQFKPLPKRINIVITSKPKDIQDQTVITSSSLDSALEKAYIFSKNVFVIGGAQLYNRAINHAQCTKLILTEIKQNYECDAFFPDFKQSWKKVSSTMFDQFEINIYNKL